MLFFMYAQVLAAEPSKEIIISSVSQDSSAREKLGADQLSSFEIAGVYGLKPNLSVLLSYGYGTITTNYDTPYRESSYVYDYYDNKYAFESAFAQHMLSVGPRYRHIFNDWASVYGKAEGTLSFSSIRYATSVTEEEPISQRSSSALSFGVTVAGGLMGSFQFRENMPQVLISLELGYSAQGASTYEKLGSLDLSGAYSSLGAGLRF